MQKSSYLLLFFLMALILSCDSNRVFDSYKPLPNTWHKDSIISFKIQPPDTITPYNLFLNIRTNQAYKYSNLFVITEIQFPHGKSITDTLEYRLAKPNGTFLGSGFGSVKTHKLWYKEGVVFNESGLYTLEISQAMRQNGQKHGIINLDGILDVGFRIEKTK